MLGAPSSVCHPAGSQSRTPPRPFLNADGTLTPGQTPRRACTAPPHGTWIPAAAGRGCQPRRGGVPGGTTMPPKEGASPGRPAASGVRLCPLTVHPGGGSSGGAPPPSPANSWGTPSCALRANPKPGGSLVSGTWLAHTRVLRTWLGVAGSGVCFCDGPPTAPLEPLPVSAGPPCPSPVRRRPESETMRGSSIEMMCEVTQNSRDRDEPAAASLTVV